MANFGKPRGLEFIESFWVFFNDFSWNFHGNITSFPSLRFYVKTILGILEVQNLHILKDLEVLNFDFYEFLHFLNVEIDQIN